MSTIVNVQCDAYKTKVKAIAKHVPIMAHSCTPHTW